MSETQSSCSSHSQVITCKAVVCWGIGEAGKVEEIQVEPPKASEVRVKMLNASLCHTDILISKGHPIAVEGARVQGAARIIGIDKNDGKREKGKAFGMTDFINPDHHHHHHKSVSQSFECTGNKLLLVPR
ncbi:hypothetical protein L3X38_015252 [Prunus dulcis]|uniref:Alcohol dehydrogenase-like C-terminal domain-containing protein n=1 Tax=Prunus dulcis TaxID=3755 RepID=A0AAD4WPR7_PRUDU|nr:hypothetical protein L3X38_015252 [Prunus dulcis]